MLISPTYPISWQTNQYFFCVKKKVFQRQQDLLVSVQCTVCIVFVQFVSVQSLCFTMLQVVYVHMRISQDKLQVVQLANQLLDIAVRLLCQLQVFPLKFVYIKGAELCYCIYFSFIQYRLHSFNLSLTTISLHHC